MFGLINTALGIKNPIEEIQVSEEDLATLDPPAEEVEATQQTTDEVIDLDGEDVRAEVVTEEIPAEEVAAAD